MFNLFTLTLFFGLFATAKERVVTVPLSEMQVVHEDYSVRMTSLVTLPFSNKALQMVKYKGMQSPILSAGAFMASTIHSEFDFACSIYVNGSPEHQSVLQKGDRLELNESEVKFGPDRIYKWDGEGSEAIIHDNKVWVKIVGKNITKSLDLDVLCYTPSRKGVVSAQELKGALARFFSLE